MGQEEGEGGRGVCVCVALEQIFQFSDVVYAPVVITLAGVE